MRHLYYPIVMQFEEEERQARLERKLALEIAAANGRYRPRRSLFDRLRRSPRPSEQPHAPRSAALRAG
jgi:hypothetical protein